MIAHICAHPGVSSAPQAGGNCKKVGGGTETKIFPALRAGIRAPHFQFASGASDLANYSSTRHFEITSTPDR